MQRLYIPRRPLSRLELVLLVATALLAFTAGALVA
jgi:hypothetical protein